jgi:hypothetical protein
MEAICHVLICIPPILIALLLACALRIVCRGSARSVSSRALADDPFLFPIGECPTVDPGFQREARAIPNYRRHLDPTDFRAWGVPGPFCDRPAPASAGALRRNEGGGRPDHTSPSGTAVVLKFERRPA